MDKFALKVKTGEITKAEAERRRKQARSGISSRVRNPGRAAARSGSSFKPSVTARGDTITATNTEVVKIFHSSEVIQREYKRLIPADFPYLRACFNSYSKFRFRKASLSWEPLATGLHYGGSVGIAHYGRFVPSSDIDLVRIANSPGSWTGPVSESGKIDIPLKGYSDDWFNAAQDPLVPEGAIEFMFWYLCLANQTHMDPSVPVGMLRVSYTIELTDPIFPHVPLYTAETQESADSTVRRPPPNPVNDFRYPPYISTSGLDDSKCQQILAFIENLRLSDRVPVTDELPVSAVNNTEEVGESKLEEAQQ